MADFAMYAGDTATLVVTVTDSSGAVDLTGASVKWQASSIIVGGFEATPSIEKSLDDGIAITNAEGGVFDVRLDPSDTESLSGKFYHEAELTDASGNVSTILTGRMTVTSVLIRAT